jgi:two-component system sensor histidine kinase UhpB
MTGRTISLFWRLFLPNATVLAVASIVLMVQPANGRVLVLIGGLLTLLAVNLVLMRRAFAPLARLTRLMREIDPLRPGQRLPVLEPTSEVNELAGAFNEMLDRLERERRESARRALVERERERRHLARELHDEIGQTLTALGLQLDRLARRLAPEQRDEAIAARDAALGTVEDVRALAARLRPEGLDTLGLVPALTNLVERFSERIDMPIARELHRDLPPLSPEAELVVYRVAQESLTNVVRHARARHANVSLHADGRHVVLSVQDDGVGIDGQQGSGIRGMRERALLVGADLRIRPRPDGPGTEVRLELDDDRGLEEASPSR